MIPQLSDSVIDKLGALIVHTDQMLDALYFSSGGYPSKSLEKAARQVREDLADHELMAFKIAMDREGRLPK